MSAVYFITDDDDIRLIRLGADKSSPLAEGVFSLILGVQINHNGRWISHGPRTEWLLNGGRGESHYVYGQLHGTQREWYGSGQLHIECEWAAGKTNGSDRGWYENGQPMYEAQYFHGKEIAGKAWDENGRRIK